MGHSALQAARQVAQAVGGQVTRVAWISLVLQVAGEAVQAWDGMGSCQQVSPLQPKSVINMSVKTGFTV